MDVALPFQLLQHGTPIEAPLVNESSEMYVTLPHMETLRRMLPIARRYLTARPALRVKVLWMLLTVTLTWRNSGIATPRYKLLLLR